RLLTVMTSVCACAAFGLLCISVATDYWLFTKELLPKDAANSEEQASNATKGKSVVQSSDSDDPDAKETAKYLRVYSGLWRHCTYGELILIVVYISSVNIRPASMFPLVSLFILLIGGTMCFIGHCNNSRKILTFVSGILFVLAGLCTLVGVILYISSITGEVGNKPRASIEEPKFEYDYGSSFYMAVGSFVLTELSGVLSVYLYISKYKQSQRAKHLMLKSSEPHYHHPPHHQYHHHSSSGGGHQHHHVYHHHNDRNHQSASAPSRHIRRPPRENSSDRSASRDRSREPSATRSESYFTYTPISDDTPSSSHELSSYAFPRDGSTNNTISTTAEMHGLATLGDKARDGNHVGAGNAYVGNANATSLRSTSPATTLVPSTSCGGLRTGSPPSLVPVPSIDIVRRTTPV
ncbi:hypothetical protein EGW08_009510, partial [Elysia chlorotica]